MTTTYNWSELIAKAVKRRETLFYRKIRTASGYFMGTVKAAKVWLSKVPNLLVVDHKFPLDDEIDSLVSALNEQVECETIIVKGHQSLGLPLNRRFKVVKGDLEKLIHLYRE